MPDTGTEIQVNYQEGTSAGGQVNIAIDGQGIMSGTIPGAPLLPGSIQLQFLVEQLSNVPSDARGEISRLTKLPPPWQSGWMTIPLAAGVVLRARLIIRPVLLLDSVVMND